MSVFYSYSTKNNQSNKTYLKISHKLNDNIIDVDNNPKNFSRLLDRIIQIMIIYIMKYNI